MIKRAIYYWSGIYRTQLQTGMGYKELKSVISINVMNFNIIEQTERFHTMYHLHEDVDKFNLTNIMEFHFIDRKSTRLNSSHVAISYAVVCLKKKNAREQTP